MINFTMQNCPMNERNCGTLANNSVHNLRRLLTKIIYIHKTKSKFLVKKQHLVLFY